MAKKSREEVLAGIDPDIIARANKAVMDSYYPSTGDDIEVKQVDPTNPQPVSGNTSPKAGGSWWNKGGKVPSIDPRSVQSMLRKNRVDTGTPVEIGPFAQGGPSLPRSGGRHAKRR